MLGSFKSLKPSEGYAYEGDKHRLFEYGKGLECPSGFFAFIITAENALQEGVQREERLKLISRALKR